LQIRLLPKNSMLAIFAGFLVGSLSALFLQVAPAKSSGVWLDVPYIKQSEDGCGSAAIAMLLQYWSAHGTPVAANRANAAAIQKQLYSRKARGIFAADMEQYFRESGFREFAVRGEWSDLRQHLEQGRPLIVSIQPGGAKVPLHYVVVTGMDWDREAVFINDPARGKLLRIERTEFEKEWQAARNWMLLAVPTSAN
jgi:ABC-type bacteriocin/lantibiotic exporter with double-glycine peptidase domain